MSVLTSDGEIPYRKITIGNLTFDAPVRVTGFFNPRKHLPYALQDIYGKFIYALPGGMYLLPDDTVYDPNASEHA